MNLKLNLSNVKLFTDNNFKIKNKMQNIVKTVSKLLSNIIFKIWNFIVSQPKT